MPMINHQSATSILNPGHREESLHRMNVANYKKVIAPYIKQIVQTIEDLKSKPETNN